MTPWPQWVFFFFLSFSATDLLTVADGTRQSLNPPHSTTEKEKKKCPHFLTLCCHSMLVSPVCGRASVCLCVGLCVSALCRRGIRGSTTLCLCVCQVFVQYLLATHTHTHTQTERDCSVAATPQQFNWSFADNLPHAPTSLQNHNSRQQKRNISINSNTVVRFTQFCCADTAMFLHTWTILQHNTDLQSATGVPRCTSANES